MPYELTNLHADHIALVRRAANKRTFLLLKSAGLDVEDVDLVARIKAAIAKLPRGKRAAATERLNRILEGGW